MEQDNQHKIIILAAPSGAGKTTIKSRVMQVMDDQLAFSISATTRKIRAGEKDGVDYFFISPEAFKSKMADDGFIEWEMVYEGLYYGTTKSEMERIWTMNKTPLLDIDVYGAIKVRQLFGKNALAIFIAPPSIEVLKERLIKRGTDSAEVIAKRIEKAAEEISQQIHFDHIVLNDNLDAATEQVLSLIQGFLGKIPTSNEKTHNE
ncbi:MAG: guanylate kinase [Bacteroidota bacterium]